MAQIIEEDDSLSAHFAIKKAIEKTWSKKNLMIPKDVPEMKAQLHAAARIVRDRCIERGAREGSVYALVLFPTEQIKLDISQYAFTIMDSVDRQISAALEDKHDAYGNKYELEWTMSYNTDGFPYMTLEVDVKLVDMEDA